VAVYGRPPLRYTKQMVCKENVRGYQLVRPYSNVGNWGLALVWTTWRKLLRQMSKKINKFNFPYVEINRWKIEFMDLFAHMAELEVQKYPPSCPYWVYPPQFHFKCR